jgi:hypothetical protein
MLEKIGALVIVKANFQLSKNQKICDGDYGISNWISDRANHCSLFDYLVVCNGIEIFLFKHEMELVTK